MEETMRVISILFAFAGMVGCNFEGEVDPDIECSSDCEEERDNCSQECEDTCISDEDETACIEDCDRTCEETYDECSFSCSENE
jgi:hypothetical protein